MKGTKIKEPPARVKRRLLDGRYSIYVQSPAVYFTENGKRYWFGLHQVVWFLNTGKWPTSLLDHIDRNPLNCDISNLRLATESQNRANSKPHKDNPIGFRGVHFTKNRKRYISKITKNYKQIYIGYYDTAVEAAKAYDKKAVELYGEYAYLNFPNEHHG